MRLSRLQNKRHYTLTLLALLVLLIPVPAFAAVVDTVYTIVSMVFGGLVWASGRALDLSYAQFVGGFGGTFNNQGIGFVVNELWTVVRDLFNILFIFGLIYIGFRTILFTDDNSTKKNLGMLIIAALLINFSLFATKAIVDVSNITAVQVHSALTNDNNTISNTFLGLVRFTTIFSSKSVPDEAGDSEWWYVFGVLLFCLVTTITFFAGAFMLIARFIALVFFLILSPVMFIGMIFPKFAQYGRDYWDRFLKYAFFAPAYLFALYLSARVLEILGNNISDGDYAAALTSGQGYEIIFFFITAMAFMIGSIIVAQKMGVAGAGTTMSVFDKSKGWVRNTPLNFAGSVTARAGRTTLGRVGYNLKEGKSVFGTKNAGLGQKIRNTKGGRGLGAWTARQADAVAIAAAGASYDARRTGAGKSLGLNQGKKGGYQQIIENRIKAEKAFASSLTDDSQIYSDNKVSEEYENYSNLQKERDARFAELAQEKDSLKRQYLTEEIQKYDMRIKGMEEAHKSKKPDWFDGDQTEWEEMKAPYEKFAKVRNAAKGYAKRLYASNLENRYGALESWLIDSNAERQAAAAAIRKEVGKGNDEKIIDAIKSSSST